MKNHNDDGKNADYAKAQATSDSGGSLEEHAVAFRIRFIVDWLVRRIGN